MNSPLLTRVREVGLILMYSPNSSPAVISSLKIERGLALQDLITGAYEYIETIDFGPAARVYLLDQLASTE